MSTAIQKFALKVIETPYAALILGFAVMLVVGGVREFSYWGVNYSLKDPFRSIIFALGVATVLVGIYVIFRGLSHRPVNVRADPREPTDVRPDPLEPTNVRPDP